VIDSYVPVHDREAGSLRLLHIVKLLCEQGGSVIFLPQNGLALQPYASQLQQMGVEVLYPTPKQSSLDRQLRDRLPLIDFAWICRPEIFGEFYPVLREKPSLKLVYDTIDLHFMRLRRQWELDRSDLRRR
jgi:O-antigen biosynthesis protein